MPGSTMTRTETIKERKRRRTTKQNTCNSSNLVEQVTPQIIFLGTKQLSFLRIPYFKWMRIFNGAC